MPLLVGAEAKKLAMLSASGCRAPKAKEVTGGGDDDDDDEGGEEGGNDGSAVPSCAAGSEK